MNLVKNVHYVNEGLADDGTNDGYLIVGQVLVHFNILDGTVCKGYDITNILLDVPKIEQSYEEDGGDEEYESIDQWFGVVDWIIKNCPEVKVYS